MSESDDRGVPPSDVEAYQLSCLRAELDHVTSPVPNGSGSVGFFRRHALQLYWTVTRKLGLSHLHDGSRRAAKRKPLEIPGGTMIAGATCPLDPERPRILIDVSTTVFIKQATGIQVVVREFALSCYALGIGHPVFISADGIFSAVEAPDAPPLPLRAADHLFLLDASWSLVDVVAQAASAVRAVGGGVSVCVYDLVPFLYAPLAPPGVTAMYRRWFETILPLCDIAFCISRSVANELETYLRAGGSRPAHPRIEWFDLAVRPSSTVGSGSERLQKICDPARTFLSVGTLEPRKGIPVALDAFDLLWAEGYDVHYVVIGRVGWHMRFFEKRIRSHPMFGTRLHWLDDGSDAEVAYAYRHARALLSPSIAEGFGLPLIEAAHAGLPLIVSDIPVFREVTDGAALFVPPCRPADWAAAIAGVADGTVPLPSPRPRREGWTRSVEMVRDVVWAQRPALTAAPPPAPPIPAEP